MRNIKWEDELDKVMKRNRFRMYVLFVAVAINILLIGYYMYQVVSEPTPSIIQVKYDKWESLENCDTEREVK